jgi:hypothetical protein
MTERPFLSTRMMNVTIPRLNARGLETDLGIDGRSIAFDHKGEVVGPITVAIVWANREPRGEGSDTVNTIGIDGDLIGRPAELPVVEAGDLFMVGDALCEVTSPVIVDAGEARCGFRLTSGGA